MDAKDILDLARIKTSIIMFTQLTLNRFKCFSEAQELPLSQVTFLYGLNGRGKSSVIQSMLLLSQTMRATNSVDILPLSGEFINLGRYTDVRNAYADQNDFIIGLKYATEKREDTLSLLYTSSKDTPFSARIVDTIINGQSRSDSLVSLNPNDKESGKVTISSSDSVCLQMLKDISYIAANRLGVANVENRTGANSIISSKGENVLNVLATSPIKILTEVEKELSYILSGASIKIMNRADTIELYLDSTDNSHQHYIPMNVGFGYGYVLPTIVQTLLAKPNSILIIENPESHLHPGAQSRLIGFLLKKAVEKNLQLIIESHSDHIVNGLRVAVKSGLIKSEAASILHFERGGRSIGNPTIDNIEVFSNGALSFYPDDFLDEWTKQLLNLC